MIYATAAAATLFARSVQSSDPELAKAIYNTEPMIFTLAGLPDIKLNGMKDALEIVFVHEVHSTLFFDRDKNSDRFTGTGYILAGNK